MKDLIDILHREICSLVLKDAQGNIRTFFKKGVRDLEDLLDQEPETLRGAIIADKVIGKAAAGMMAYGGVKEVYADILSSKAIPMLEENGIKWSCNQQVDHIIIPEGDDRCPLEEIVDEADSAEETVGMLRSHFGKMQKLSRRQFLRNFSVGSASLLGMLALDPMSAIASPKKEEDKPKADNNMTYRVNRHTNDKVSLLGFGMMRLPHSGGGIDQQKTNELVDYALAHGVNYFDTAPVYRGSEVATGNALSRHKRSSYYLASKCSDKGDHSLEFGKQMFATTLKNLKTDYIDYYLLHSVGGGGMAKLKERFIDNGLLDWLCEQRDKGIIRNLGFSYHGDVKVFDWLIDHADKYKFTFCQIEMNYIDWRHASSTGGGWKKDADAAYLYEKSEKAGIQNVVMEPLLGGRLADIPSEFDKMLKDKRPDDSNAAWGLRWVGTHSNILTTLSGMNKMEHVVDNIKTYSPLDPCTPQEYDLLESVANGMMGYPVVPCTACKYCMPCPYNVDIPGNFAYYNEQVNKHQLPDKTKPDYAEKKSAFIKGWYKAIPEENRADQCMDCEACLPKCPQSIRIPMQLAHIIESTR